MNIEVPQSTAEFDISIQRKVEQKNNSGYLPACYETTEDFPEVPDYHFRIEDDRTIIELKRLQQQSQPLEFTFGYGSQEHQEGMNRLKDALDSLVFKFKEAPCETHGYYEIDEDEYDHEAAYRQNELHAGQSRMTQEFQQLSLKPKYVAKLT